MSQVRIQIAVKVEGLGSEELTKRYPASLHWDHTHVIGDNPRFLPDELRDALTNSAARAITNIDGMKRND